MPLATLQPDLLLVRVALQNPSVDRGALLEAIEAWSAEPSRSIRAILLERNLISSADLESAERLASNFQAQQDTDAARTVTHVGQDESPQIPGHRSTNTPQGSRFRILRPHARGGLGEVFVAEDGELHREVALKQMQARHADNERIRARFILEAEITGRLEHPSIVPVYGLNTDADGRPFYAMRFVRGESFRQAIASYHASSKRNRNAAGTLEFRKLLGRFVAMCDAIAYAHSRGVLHRDLKPDNVMLGKYGETLVVDWGLAKAIGKSDTPAGGSHSDEHILDPLSGDDVAETQMGTAIGTPGYLSPEQATGRIDELGPATDIYSLGATLYYLLVNRPPVRGDDLRTILDRTQRGEIRPPRQVDARVPRGLEAICLKALATRPEDRYPSARALADDVEQWLADEPVSAVREGPLARLGRWTRKHRALVGSMAAAIVLVAVVATVAAFSIDRARREASDLAAANGQLATTNENLAENERQAKEQAEQSALEAKRQRDVAIDTIMALVYDVQDQLANRAGVQELKRRILESASKNLAAIELISGSRGQKLDQLSVAAIVKLGDVFFALGSLDQAATFYREASDALTKALEADPRDLWARQVISVAQVQLGEILQQRGDLPGARSLFEQSLSHRKILVKEEPDDIERERELVSSYNRLAEVTRQEGDLSAARRLYEQGQEITARIAAARPDDRQAQRDLAISSSRLGDVFLRQGDPATAETFFRRDLEISRGLAEADPDDVQAKQDLVIADNRLGDLLLETDPSAAKAFHEEALAISQALAEADKNNVTLQRGLSIAYHKMGDLAMQAKDWNTAREHFTRALAMNRTCAEKDPGNAQAQRDLSVANERLGDIMVNLGDRAAAFDHFREAMTISERLAAADPTNAQAQRDLSVTLTKMGDIAAQLGHHEGARFFYERGLAIRVELAKADTANAGLRHDMMVSHARLGSVFDLEKKYTEAQGAYEAALAILDQMIADGIHVTRSDEKRAMFQASLEASRKAAQKTERAPETEP